MRSSGTTPRWRDDGSETPMNNQESSAKPRANRGIPARDTPEAVILLVRLARANLVENGKPLAGELLDLAGMLNARLPAATRVRPDDPRLREPMRNDGPALLRKANMVINRCADNPAYWAGVDRRLAALTSIVHYFVWSHALWKAVEKALDAASSLESDENTSVFDDLDEHHTGLTLQWLASLCTVVRGFEELAFSDAAVEAALAAGGSATVAGSHRERLERVRQGMLEVRNLATDAVDFRDIWETEFLSWVMELDEKLARFFRDAMDNCHPAIAEWVTRGLERTDPTMKHPLKRLDDPLAAAERLMAMLLEPTDKGARKRRQDMTTGHLMGANPGPWITAVLSLRDAGTLSADEAMYHLFDLVMYGYHGLDDEEVTQLFAEMERIEQDHGIVGDIEAAELIPEWEALSERRDQRLQAIRSAYLRTMGAHEAAALLEQSYEAFEEAADRGNAEFHRRWPDRSTVDIEAELAAYRKPQEAR